MKELVRELLGDELADYLELIRAKLAFAEEFYGIKMNYVPLITEDRIVILDKKDGGIKWLEGRRPLSDDELRELAERIRENLESGYVESLLTMHMAYVNGPGE